MSNSSLKLFLSHPLISGGVTNTSFTTVETEITKANALDFFRYDSTTIRFKDGCCTNENFEYATAVHFCFDNNHSDNPSDWDQPDKIASHLRRQCINHLIAPSQDHLLLMNDKVARPGFQVILPLSAPVDRETYARARAQCLRLYKTAGPKIESEALKIYGFGDNPYPFNEVWFEGLYFDEKVRAPFCSPHNDTAFDWSSDAGKKLHDVLKDESFIGELLSHYIGDVYLSKSTTNDYERVRRRVVLEFKGHGGCRLSFSDEVMRSTTPSSDEWTSQSMLVPFAMGFGSDPTDAQGVTLRLTPKMSGDFVVLEIVEAEPPKSVRDQQT